MGKRIVTHLGSAAGSYIWDTCGLGAGVHLSWDFYFKFRCFVHHGFFCINFCFKKYLIQALCIMITECFWRFLPR